MKKFQIAAFALVASLGVVQAQDPNELSECEKQEGFISLFDGKTLKSFTDNFTPYAKGVNTNTTPVTSGWNFNATEKAIMSGPSVPDLRGKILYRDFDLRMSYRNNGNQGVFYRVTTKEGSAYETGIEVGIENDPDYIPNRSAGSAYDMFAPKKKNYKVFSTGLWNELRIVVKRDANGNDSAEHWMNGELIVSFRYHSDEWWTIFDKCKFKDFKDFAMTAGDRKGPVPDGYIGLQGNHGGIWAIRNLRINSSNKVKIGPVTPPAQCLTGIGASEKKADPTARFSFERSHNSISVKVFGTKAETISLLSLDGREVARGKIDADGQSANFSGWGHPGVYMIRASSAGKVVLNDQIFLQ